VTRHGEGKAINHSQVMGCGTVVVIVHAPHGPVLGSIPTLLYGRGRKFLHSTPMAFTFGWHIRSSPMASTLGWDIRSARWPAFRTTLPRCRYRYRGCLTLHVVPPKSHTYTITYIHNHTHTHTHPIHLSSGGSYTTCARQSAPQTSRHRILCG